MGNPVAVGRLAGVEAFALAVGKAHKALARTVFADKAVGQQQQVADLHRQHAAATRLIAQVMANKTPGLPVLRNPCAGKVGHPGKQQEVTGQRQHHTAGQWVDLKTNRAVEQGLDTRQHIHRPAEAAGEQRHDQGVEPDQGAKKQPGKYTLTVSLLPHQRAKHCRGQLADGGK